MGAVAAVGSIILGTGAVSSVLGGATHRRPGAPAPPPMLQQERAEDEATKVAAKRRRLYAGLGRQSTILTGPGGLDMDSIAKSLYGGGIGGKQLLGM